MTKFKIGDKVRRVTLADEFVECMGKDFGVVTDVLNSGDIQVDKRCYWDSKYFRLYEDDWTIHNNTKPLSELSDEQRGLLFNYRCNGGSIETEASIGWVTVNNPQWLFTGIYRAKQKSERELFIDATTLGKGDFLNCGELSLVNKMFDIGFKAPETK